MPIATVRVVTYHRVLPSDAPGAPNPTLVSATPAVFAAQMRHLARRYRVIAAEEVAAAFRDGRPLPPRAVLVTFDDAYRDVGEIAWPILRRLGLPATVFVPTACTGGRCTFWWDRLHQALRATRCTVLHDVPGGPLPLHDAAARGSALRALQGRVKALPHADAMDLVERVCDRLGLPHAAPSDVLDWDALRELARDGMTIGAHTRTHPALSRMPLPEARDEVVGSRDDVRREIGAAPVIFAYPYGMHDERVVQLVREAGFPLAVTCLDGHNRVPAADPLRLCRTNVTPRTSPLVFALRLTALGARLDRVRHQRIARETTGTAPAPAGARPRIAYVVSRFPKLTETFVLYELVALERLGVSVDLYPLLRERQPVTHPEADRWTRRARFLPFVSPGIARAHLHYLRRAPGRYARALHEALAGTMGSANFLAGAVAFFPKAVRFAYEMERAGVTHVHAHFCTHPALVALVVHRLTGIPFSFTAHGSDLHVNRRMLDAKVHAAAFVVAVSRFNRRVILDECGEAADTKVHVVHCGVEPDAFPQRPAGRGPGPLRLLCVASHEEVKGHRVLVDACARLRERGVDFVCDLVGEGPLRSETEAHIARRGLGGRVRVLGGRPRPAVIRLLAAADVAVLASRPTRQGKREGIPVVLMEAMASALPVVSTAISGIPELVEDGCTGILVPPADAAALADALERLAGDEALRRRMGDAGRRKVAREFDLQANAARLLDLVGAPGGLAGPVPAAWSAVASAAAPLAVTLLHSHPSDSC